MMYQDEERWIWGVEDATVISENRNKVEPVQTSTERFQPFSTLFSDGKCNFPKPPKPSFSAPGRKISEEKCEEYKWDKKTEKEQEKKAFECLNDKYKGPGEDEPSHAIGGRDTHQGEFPHMGAIGWKAVVGGYLFKCGSTLISSKFVLTAAHCSRASSVDSSLADVVPKILRLNDKNLFQIDDNGLIATEDVNISRIIVHPEFKPPKKYFDIALMELQHEVTFTWRIQPACLWTKDDVTELGTEATLTGWGVLKLGSPYGSPKLQAAVLNILNNSFCDQLLNKFRNRNWQGFKDNQLCAGVLPGGIDSCQGDSGGPLQVKQDIEGTDSESVYQVIGVTSFGIFCALPNLPGVYTRVSSFIDWIERNVWPESFQ